MSWDGRADFVEGGRDVGRSVMEGGASVTNGDTHEVDAFSMSSEGAKERVLFLGLLDEFLLASDVLALADLEEDEVAVDAVEGVGDW